MLLPYSTCKVQGNSFKIVSISGRMLCKYINFITKACLGNFHICYASCFRFSSMKVLENMQAKKQHSMLTLFLIIIICITLINVPLVHADEGPPTEPPAPTQVETEPPTEPPAAETSVLV